MTDNHALPPEDLKTLDVDARCIGCGSELLPKERLLEILPYLKGSLAPGDTNAIGPAMAPLKGMVMPRGVADPDQFWNNLKEVAAAYPTIDIKAAVHEIINTQSYVPDPSKFRLACDGRRMRTRDRIATARAMLSEHERRARASADDVKFQRKFNAVVSRAPARQRGSPEASQIPSPPSTDTMLASERMIDLGRKSEIEELWLREMANDAALATKAKQLPEEERHERGGRR